MPASMFPPTGCTDHSTESSAQKRAVAQNPLYTSLEEPQRGLSISRGGT